MLATDCAYCFMCKAARKMESITENRTGDFLVATGQCGDCGENVVRVYPLGTGLAEAPTEPQSEAWEGSEVTGYYGVVPATLILANVIDSVDIKKDNENQPAQWQKIVAVKAASGHFDNVLRTIIRETLQMRIVMWDPQHGGDINHPSGMWVIGNGHHRLVAALLLGLDNIPIVLSVNRNYMRAEDSQDEDWPIERDWGRLVWDAIKDRTPGGVVPGDSDPVAYACECDAVVCDGECASEPSELPSASTADVVRMHARNAAAQAVWDLMGPVVQEARKAQERARDMQEQAARMYEAAEQANEEAERLNRKAEQLRALYNAAANIAE